MSPVRFRSDPPPPRRNSALRCEGRSLPCKQTVLGSGAFCATVSALGQKQHVKEKDGKTLQRLAEIQVPSGVQDAVFLPLCSRRRDGLSERGHQKAGSIPASPEQLYSRPVSQSRRGGAHGREVLSEARLQAQQEAAGSNPAPPSSGTDRRYTPLGWLYQTHGTPERRSGDRERPVAQRKDGGCAVAGTYGTAIRDSSSVGRALATITV